MAQRNEFTSKKVASKAGKILGDKSSSKKILRLCLNCLQKRY